MTRIFISYRRSDTKWAAGRIYDEIAKVLGRDDIFFDVSSIDPGEDFAARIGQIVGECDILLVIMGPSWVGAKDRAGQRRLDDPRDLTRIEVATALARNIRVIPILVDGAEMPDPLDLPDDLAGLARRNAHDVSFARFHADLESFVRVLQRILAGPRAAAPTVQQVEREQANAETSKPVLKELPFTICIETLGGVASPLLKKGARLPAEASEVFSTATDNQSQVEVKLSIGNRAMAKDNTLAGTFVLSGIPPAARAVPQIKITAVVDPSLLLTVTAEDQATGHKQVLDAVDLTRLEIPPEASESTIVCPECSGSGQVTQKAGVMTFNLTCPTCGGSGKRTKEGAENAKARQKAAVPDLPKGFTDIFDKYFGKSKEAGGDHGDAAQQSGSDATLDLQVSFEEALMGTVKTVNTSGKSLQVRVPPGVDTGTRLRMREVVEPAKPGQKRGDLYLNLQVGEHPQYKRQGNDLYYVAPISETAARRGVTLALPPLGTNPGLELEVPAGTPMGTRFRVDGKGFPGLREATKAGDLYVTVQAKR